MNKSEQTSDLLLRLQELSVIFTKRYQPQYYYQYRGELYDLAMEIYCDFLTPKGRGEKKETLLDKFDATTTSLEYLVKVCVIRKLIDKSRANPLQFQSLDESLETKGDSIYNSISFLSDSGESALTDERFLNKVEMEFNKLPELVRNQHYVALFECDSPLAKRLKPVIRYIHQSPIQQITDKTAVLFIPQFRKCIDFSLFDGHAKGRFQPFRLEREILPTLTQYQSLFSRSQFEEYCNNNLYCV